MAFTAYRRGQCDKELVTVCTKNGMFKHLSRYLVKRQDLALWGEVLTQSPNRKMLVDAVVQTAQDTKVMDFVTRLDNYDAMDIADIASEAQLHEVAYTVYTKWNHKKEAMRVLMDDIKSIERATDFAEKCNDTDVWSLLGREKKADEEAAAKKKERSTFESSTFNSEYSAAKAPMKSYELLKAVDDLITAYGQCHHVPPDEIQGFYSKIEMEAFRHGEKLAHEIDAATQLMWTSTKTMVVAGREVELCSIINAATRSEDRGLVAPVAVVARAINRLCVVRTRAGTVPLLFPPRGVLFRGGGFNDAFKAFFYPGRMYRVPAFLATSLNQSVSERFLYRAVVEHGRSGIMWQINVDPRGEKEFPHMCKNANFVYNIHCPQEAEYLFAAFSVFTVVSVVWSANPDGRTPHRITIQAMTDNRDAPADLELAPWF